MGARNAKTDPTQVELFENAFRYAPIGMALVGLDGAFVKVNAAFCELVGFSAEELLSLDFQTITHPEDLESDLEQLCALKHGRIHEYQMEKRYLRPDGSTVWVNLSVSMVGGVDGRPGHFIAQVQDLTARRESEALYRLMAENIHDVVVTTDLKGRVCFVSPSIEAVSGWSAAEMTGRRPMDYAHPDDFERLITVFRRIAQGGQGEAVRWRFRHRTTGAWVWVESNPTRLGLGEGSVHGYFLDVLRDVTAQVEQERALEKATAAATTAATTKADFLANMSHEIRTPLTAVLGFAGLLSNRTDLSDECKGFVSRIASASSGLLAIVNDVLDFSKLEAGQFEIKPRPANPEAIAQDVVGLLSEGAQAKGLTLTLDLDPSLPDQVSLDPERLRQVLLNLVGNAVKFTEIGSVTLRMSHFGERLTCSVIDTGPGLSDDQKAKLFQRFSQVDGSSTRRHGGTGLGLAICKGLVETMGGRIEMQSVLGQGATFTFTITAPLCEAPPAPRDEAEIVGSAEGLRVLVTDDNPTNRELVRAVLEQVGAEVTEAENGLKAVEICRVKTFDVILMDIRMPVMDGPTAFAHIRDEPGPNCEAPVIAFSAGANLEVHLDEGFDACVPKPIDTMHLFNTIAACLDMQEAEARRFG